MARQSRDDHSIGVSVEVTTAGLHVSAVDSSPREPAIPEAPHGTHTGTVENTNGIPAGTARPSFLGMAASFAGSMAKFAASGFKRVDEQSHRLRMAQCKPCEHRRRTRCDCCGCFIAKKAWLPHEDCPIGRWPL